MIERIAQAIYEAAGDAAEDYEEWCSMPMAEAAARAVLAAMREPTEAMCDAGHLGHYITRDDANDVWRAMIDAALKESVE